MRNAVKEGFNQIKRPGSPVGQPRLGGVLNSDLTGDPKGAGILGNPRDIRDNKVKSYLRNMPRSVTSIATPAPKPNRKKIEIVPGLGRNRAFKK